MPSLKNKRVNRRDRRKAKQSGFRRDGKNMKRVGHGSSLGWSYERGAYKTKNVKQRRTDETVVLTYPLLSARDLEMLKKSIATEG